MKIQAEDSSRPSLFLFRIFSVFLEKLGQVRAAWLCLECADMI